MLIAVIDTDAQRIRALQGANMVAYRFYPDTPEKGYDTQNGWVPLNALALFEVVNNQVNWYGDPRDVIRRIAREEWELGVSDAAPWDLLEQSSLASLRFREAAAACDEYERTTYDGGFCEEEAARLEAVYNARLEDFKAIVRPLENIALVVVGDTLTPA